MTHSKKCVARKRAVFDNPAARRWECMFRRSRHQRLVRLLHLLQTNRVQNTKEISKSLGVTRRTVFRDLSQLQRHGIDVQYSLESKGYSLPASLLHFERLGCESDFAQRTAGTLWHVIVHIREKIVDELNGTIWHPAQRLEARDDGWLHWELQTDRLGHLVWWLLGFEGDAKVVSPELLSNELDRQIELFPLS